MSIFQERLKACHYAHLYSLSRLTLRYDSRSHNSSWRGRVLGDVLSDVDLDLPGARDVLEVCSRKQCFPQQLTSNSFSYKLFLSTVIMMRAAST